MGNIKCFHKNCFYSLFIQTKINKQTKQNKTVVKIMKVLNYLLGGETANHVNFMQHMLVSHSSYYFFLCFFFLSRKDITYSKSTSFQNKMICLRTLHARARERCSHPVACRCDKNILSHVTIYYKLQTVKTPMKCRPPNSAFHA